MRFRKLKIIPLTILLVSFFLIGSSNAQPTLLFELAPSLELAQIVYVSDFDFYQQGATQYLFLLTVNNRNPVTGYLNFEILHNGERIAETRSNVFSLMQNESFPVTNMQLNAGFVTPDGKEHIRFEKSNTTNPSQEFDDEVLTGGKLPKGNYSFIVKYLFNNGSEETSAPPTSIFINNPTFIRPITPGTRASDGYLEILYTQFPTFQFETDFDPTFSTSEPFHVQVFKKLDQHGSIDEVLTTQPHYDDFMLTTVFPYPPAAVQPLDPGVYVWRIQLNMITSSGTEVLESPVYAFRVEDPSSLSEFDDEGVKSEVMRILIDLLGNRGEEIAKSLSDYNLIAIRVNGETITKKKLYEIIDSYEGEERLISDIILKGTQQ